MDNDDKNVFMTRSAPDNYDTLMIVPKFTGRSVGEFRELASAVFGYMPSAFPPPQHKSQFENQQGKSKALEIPLSELAAAFYGKFYAHTAVRLTRENSHSGLASKNDAIELFVKDLTAPLASDVHPRTPRNKLLFLTGEVGSGKTTFLNYIISEKLPLLVNGGNKDIWFVKFDIEDDRNPFLYFVNEAKFISDLALKTVHIVSSNYKEVGQGIVDKCSALKSRAMTLGVLVGKENEYEDRLEWENNLARAKASCLQTLFEVIRIMKQHGHRRLVLILDNVDFIAHLHTRSVFFEASGSSNRKSEQKMNNALSLQQFAQFVSVFYDSGLLRELGATILISIRPENYGLLTESFNQSQDTQFARLDHLKYVLTAADKGVVILSRFSLLRFGIKCLEDRGIQKGKRGELNDLLKVIMKNALNTPDGMIQRYLDSQDPVMPESLVGHGDPLFSRLLGISRHKYREVVEFLSMYSNLASAVGAEEYEHGGAQLTRNFLHSAPVALLAFILNRHAYFSQKESGFPNIYLATVPNTDHKHSYWLKALLLATIEHMNDRAGAVLPDYLEAWFCPEGQPNVYDRSLVLECLGSLSETRTSNMIRTTVRHSYNPTGSVTRITNIILTERAKLCRKNDTSAAFPTPIFDRFAYLQLILDEADLPIPIVALEHFMYDNANYCYLVNPQVDTYKQSAKDMILKKAKQVVLFIDILELYLEVEKFRYSAVFEKLLNLGITLPDSTMLRAMRNNVYDEIRALQPSMGLSKTIVQEIEKWCGEQRKKVKDAFQKTYKHKQHE